MENVQLDSKFSEIPLITEREIQFPPRLLTWTSSAPVIFVIKQNAL
jgi:hypothetical protein